MFEFLKKNAIIFQEMYTASLKPQENDLSLVILFIKSLNYVFSEEDKNSR